MRLEDIQLDLEKWVARNFPDQTLEQSGLILAEEVGELLRCIVKRAQGVRGTHEEWTRELGKELGDVQVALAVVAEKAGLNLAYEVGMRTHDLLARDWTTDRNGHGLPQ